MNLQLDYRLSTSSNNMIDCIKSDANPSELAKYGKKIEQFDCSFFIPSISAERSFSPEFRVQVQHNDTSVSPLPMPAIVSAVLVVVGWFVVNRAQANRERRKQIRETASNLSKDLIELEKDFLKYHTEERDKTVEPALLSRMTRFEKSCQNLPQYVSSQHKYLREADIDKITIKSSSIKKMREAMTLNHFMGEHEVKVNHDAKLISDIEVSVDEMHELFELVRIAALD